MADDVRDNNYTIDASPTDQCESYTKRSQRSRRRKTCTAPKPITATQLQCEIANLGDLELREAQLFVADRLDCLRAQQEPVRQRLVPASQNFSSLQFLLQNEQLPLEKPEPEQEHLLRTPANIVEEILQDFCGSPSYVAEDQFTYDDVSPWFRFRKKQIKTYSRHVLVKSSPANDEDDRLSCSSGLSVQEDFNTQVPTNKCNFDANSSQIICENLLNLSAFFTQRNNANTSVDLPETELDLKNCTLLEPLKYNELEDDATDVLGQNGYLIGNTEQCKYFDDNCDNKTIDNAEFSLFNERSRLLSTQTPSKENHPQDTHLCGDWFDGDFNPQKGTVNDTSLEKEFTKSLLEEIPLSEWQPLDIEDSLNETNIKAEVQPMDIPEAIEFKTASNKIIEVSEEKQKEAARLMADLEASYSQKQVAKNVISENIEFRTASNKTVQLTDEMRKKALMLMSDLEANAANLQNDSGFCTASNKKIVMTEKMQKAAASLMSDLEVKNQATDCEMLEGIPFSEWQPMDMPNNFKQEAEETNVDNQWDAIAFSEWQPLDTLNEIEFRTASNKAIDISEEKQAEAAKLMAAVKTSYSQELEDPTAKKPLTEISENIEFRTASNKIMKLTEEMQKKAALLMANLETDEVDLKNREDCVEIRTASNKTINVSEEKQKEAAKLMADVKASCSQASTNLHSENLECIGFRTASNKTVKLTEEMLKKAATLMADLEENNLQKSPTQNVPSSPSSSNKEEEIPNQPNETNIENTLCSDVTRQHVMAATPKQSQRHTLVTPLELPFETPKCTPELQASLTQLTERSPLDRATKSSIITRRNLLSLNKRRKLKRDSENCSTEAGQTPVRLRFAPMAAATSTPVPSRNANIKDDLHTEAIMIRDRSCSQDSSPRVQRSRVGKRRSEDALSPIYAPTHKTRRLGLSRVRNKSSHDI